MVAMVWEIEGFLLWKVRRHSHKHHHHVHKNVKRRSPVLQSLDDEVLKQAAHSSRNRLFALALTSFAALIFSGAKGRSQKRKRRPIVRFQESPQ